MVVYGLRDHFKARRLNALASRGLGRILNGDASSAARPKDAHNKINALRSSLDDHDLSRVGDDPSRAAEMIGECRAQEALTTGFPVVEGWAASPASDALHC
jgi:hypothetical protein